jgi:hypothetical protein
VLSQLEKEQLEHQKGGLILPTTAKPSPRTKGNTVLCRYTVTFECSQALSDDLATDLLSRIDELVMRVKIESAVRGLISGQQELLPVVVRVEG